MILKKFQRNVQFLVFYLFFLSLALFWQSTKGNLDDVKWLNKFKKIKVKVIFIIIIPMKIS